MISNLNISIIMLHLDQLLDRLQLSEEGECDCLGKFDSYDWWLRSRYYGNVILISCWIVYSSQRRVNVIVWGCLIN